MKFRILLAALALLCVLAPSVAQAAADIQVIDCTSNCTTDQVSGTIAKPPGAIGVRVIIDLTAGTTPLIDLNLEVFTSTAAAWTGWAVDAPSSAGITSTGTTVALFAPIGTAADYAVDAVEGVHLPDYFRVFVDHGNANAMTYTVDIQWLEK